MVVSLLVAPFAVPHLGPVLPVLLLLYLLVFQLAWLARSRTVSFATLLRTAALGALLLWPAVLLERGITGVLGLDPVGVAAYTYIAVTVEEIVKLSPLLLLLPVARRRVRRLASVDFLLLAVASGAGFQLAERLLTQVALGAPDLSRAGGLLLPGGSVVRDLEGTVTAVYSGHAVTTGLIGAALGLAIVGRRGWLWLLPVLTGTLVALDHLNFNAQTANADLHAASGVLHTLLGGGHLTPWFLLLLLVCAVVLDHRLIASAAESTPPLPGQPPLPRLRRRARGRSVALRVRVPADIAPLFRRMALWWVDLPVTLATTVSAITHEFFAALIAARRGPDTLCDTLRFLRLRRANAMGEARSRGRAWRRHPSEEELTRTARSLARRLGLAATGGITVAATLLFAVVLPTEPAGGSDTFAYALPALARFEGWLGTLTVVEIAWTALAAIAVTTLLTVGNAVPRAHPRMRDFLRSPTANTGAVLGMLAPGQIGYALLGLVGLVLPRRVDRMLVR